MMAAATKLDLADRIIGWTMSILVSTLVLFFLARDWSSLTVGSRIWIFVVGLFICRMPWMFVEDAAKQRANVCPHCGRHG
jgi:hypothetical protein